MINNGKSRILNEGDDTIIQIPSKKNWFILIFAIFWLGGWFFGFKSAFTSLYSNQSETNGFLIFWLCGWSVFGAVIIFSVLWGLFGKEKLIINSFIIILKKEIFNIGIKKEFEINEIKNINFNEIENSWFSMKNRWVMWGFGPGKIKFDYGMKTYSIGLGVDDAEAKYLVDEIKKYISLK